MLVNVQTGDFDFLGWTQSYQGFGDVGDNNRAHNEQHQGDDHGFQLLHQLRLEDVVRHISLEVGGQVRVGGLTGKHAGHDGAAQTADAVNAPRIQRVVHAEPALDLVAEEPRNGSGGNANPDGARGQHVTAS